MADFVIEGGLVVDGSGTEPFIGDVAVTGDRVTAVGDLSGEPGERIDATGKIVTPGFVDVHTHFDGQVTWDATLTPSCWHGVTTVIMGNCGVGFAPVAEEKREWLIGLMEGVEDIPGAALSEGIVWDWETYPEFLDAIERRPLALDVGSLIPHGSVRGYVMGDRGAKNEPATPEDIELMSKIVAEGLEAGAFGFSTSRTIAHMAIDGEPVPGTFAAENELFGIGKALKEAGRGVFELAPAGALGEDLAAPEKEMAWMRTLSAEIERPVVFALTQNDQDPTGWRTMLELSAEAAADGAQVHPQVAGRPVNLLLGMQTFHPFKYCPSWSEIGLLEIPEQIEAMKQPEFRAKLLKEVEDIDPMMAQFLDPERAFPMGLIPNYEPPKEESIAALAAERGVPPMEHFYDVLLEDDGNQLVMRPLLNYTGFNLDAVREMLMHPTTVWGLGDGGAHCGTTCDASTPTTMLGHWVRDRESGKLGLAEVVEMMTSKTANLFGIPDRGTLAAGMMADLNIIDLDALALPRPEMVHDLPGGARRFIQRSEGYDLTMKSGVVTFRNGEHTGELPGGLLRATSA